MQLQLVSDGTTILVTDRLEEQLEAGPLTVRLDCVPALLQSIRDAAVAVTPLDSVSLVADPARAADLSQSFVALAAAARALVAEVPADDPNAAAVNAALATLNL